MNYKTTMEEMRNQLMHTLRKDEGYKIIDLLSNEIMNAEIDKEIKEHVDIIRRQANVALIRSLIGNVLIYNKSKNTEDDFFNYKNDFEILEDLCMRKMIEEDEDL